MWAYCIMYAVSMHEMYRKNNVLSVFVCAIYMCEIYRDHYVLYSSIRVIYMT